MNKDFFKLNRDKLADAYEAEYAKDAEFSVSTLPYHSRSQLLFSVVDSQAAPAPGFAWMVARPQAVRFFDYGVGDQIPLGSAQVRAEDNDTNLAEGKSTNGAQDYVIEGISCGQRGTLLTFPASGDAGSPLGIAGSPVDSDVVSALGGQLPLFDPAALVAPPQVTSPFNLENALYQAVAPHMDVELDFDRGRTIRVGTLDLFPQGGAASLLRSNGDPHVANKFKIPEGYLWRKEGLPDSELVVTARLRRSVVVPINTVAFGSGAAIVRPTQVFLEMVMRLHGLAFNLPSMN